MQKLLASMIVVALMLVGSAPVAARAADPLTATCRAKIPVHPGQDMTWRAFPAGGSSSFEYSWSGTDGLGGTARVVKHAYADIGFKDGAVTVSDTVTGESVTANCGMHVMPTSFSEPPNVTPILWVPRGVDPTPMIVPLKRVWRSIHALFFHFYGKTFRTRPFRTIVSDKSERDLCGGDCADLGMNYKPIDQASADADRIVGPTIPYTRARVLLVWGGGGWAGSLGWFYGGGAVGDFAVAPAAGLGTPHVPPDLPDFYAILLGDYENALYGAIAHELNHTIAWDDPHDFGLHNPPNAYERRVSLAGPFLTEDLADSINPSIALQNVAGPLSGTSRIAVEASDDVKVDAVTLLVDGQYVGIDTAAPFRIPFNTRLVGSGGHRITAVALDASGNRAETSRSVVVINRVNEDTTKPAACARNYPVDTFRVCYFDGVGFDGTYLGTQVDHPFPSPAGNAAWGLDHLWKNTIAFGQGDTISGMWRGRLRFRPGTYRFHFFTDDGLRVWINGDLILDEWRDQVAEFTKVVALSGVTRIRVAWYQNEGARQLRLFWLPVTMSPG